MRSRRYAAKILGVAIVAAAALSAGQTRKEYRYTVRPHCTLSVTNQYGPISLRSAAGNQVLVRALLYSGKVEVDQRQSGNRVDILSHLLPGANAENGRVEYEVQVPPDASVTLRSTTGPLTAEKLHGDLTLEGAAAKVDVRDVSDAHVHVRTLNGPVLLTNIHDGHVEITSVSGDVTLTGVNGPLVQVNSSSGKIHYDGDFGASGQYFLTTHSGDIEATAPEDASIDVTARAIRGHVENDFPLEPEHTPFIAKAGSAFAGTIGRAASAVKLLTFSGKIHLKKR